MSADIFLHHMSNIWFFLAFFQFSHFYRGVGYIAQYEPRASGITFDFTVFHDNEHHFFFFFFIYIYVHSKLMKRTTHLLFNCSEGWT